MSGSSDGRSGTVPVCGLQYTTSPSLPSAVKAVRDIMVTSLSSTFPSTSGATVCSKHKGTAAGPVSSCPGAVPQSSLQLYDSYYGSTRGTEPAMLPVSRDRSQGELQDSLTLPDDLFNIGPSARRLLRLDAAQQQREQSGTVGPKSAPRALNVLPVASRTLLPQTHRRRKATSTPAADATVSLTALSPLPEPKFISSADRSLRETIGTLRRLERTIDVSPSKLPSSITNHAHAGSYLSTVVAAAAAPPPLVTQLQSYIKRELVLNGNGAPIPSAMDQLVPYREAFRALRTAFPAYASLFEDIQCAYDNVIQAQAELLAEAYSAVDAGHVEKVIQVESSTALHERVSELEAELTRMQRALESRVQSGQGQKSESQKSGKTTTRDVLELRRELELANQRVKELEHNSRNDLEKIVVLIGAVRECDRRLKEYERLVTSVTGQISELDEFKRIAGDAQAELQQFRMKYLDYVPVEDFQLMKEYLTSELEEARLTIRRWRRTAAVRGTQLDVMSIRLRTLEEDRTALVEESAVTAGVSVSDPGTVLTPRPSWKRIHERYPELGGYATDIGFLTTALDRDADSNALIEEVNAGGSAESSSSLVIDLGQPLVKGPKETALQVEYLVQRIMALEDLVRTQRQHLLQQEHELRPPTGKIMKEAALSSKKGPPRGSNLEGAGLRVKDKTTNAPSSPKNRPFSRAQGSEDVLSNTDGAAALSAPISRVTPPLELPLLGPGYGSHVPLCWRASGVLLRRPVAPITVLTLVYNFFLNILPKYIEQEDEARQAEDANDTGAHGNTVRLGAMLHELLQSEIQTREDLSAYDSVAHLLMNLERDAMRQEWYADALNLFLWIAHGLMPPRIAVEAAVVVAQVKRDIHSLAKELQSSRLRRQALSECLQPVLELKSPSEIEELRATLHGETTLNANMFSIDAHLFMQVLFIQECRASMDLYVSFLRALTSRAVSINVKDGRVVTAGTASIAARSARETKAPPAPQLAEGDRVLSLENVSAAILDVEPLTPEVVLREVSLNAVNTAISVTTPGTGKADMQGGTTASKAGTSEEPQVVVRLSDMVRVIGAAPLIRRTAHSTKTDCTL